MAAHYLCSRWRRRPFSRQRGPKHWGSFARVLLFRRCGDRSLRCSCSLWLRSSRKKPENARVWEFALNWLKIFASSILVSFLFIRGSLWCNYFTAVKQQLEFGLQGRPNCQVCINNVYADEEVNTPPKIQLRPLCLHRRMVKRLSLFLQKPQTYNEEPKFLAIN